MSTLTMDTVTSRSNLPRWVALLALALIALIWGGMYLRDNLPNGQSVMGHAMSGTGAAFLTPLAIVCAIGLWLRSAWGWWASLIAFGWTTISYLLTLMVVIASGDKAGLLTWSIGLLLVALVVAVLLPATRNACLKR
jgi:hypothetical protein